jgi:DNA-binding beta-propeller fold protein YncE
MQVQRRHGRLVAAVSLVLVVSAVGAAAQTVVMSGLDNPRGLAFGPDGALYVAEAGSGGPGPCGTNGANEFRCYGPTGAISRLWRGVQTRVAVGLPSAGTPGGGPATGPHDIAFLGRGGACVTLGLGGGPE